MRKLLAPALITVMLLGMASWGLAYETEFNDLHRFDRSLPGWKLGRGVNNVIAAPMELFTHMTNAAIKGSYEGAYDNSMQGYLGGATAGYISGFVTGIPAVARRATTGLLEILTFWKPEYGPTIDPEYGTRQQIFGKQDFFDPDPFWYNGPVR